MRWRLVYDLAVDPNMAVMAAVTMTGEGLSKEPAVIGTAEWWSLLGSDQLRLHSIEGRIERVYWTGHGDFPEFDLAADDGTHQTWPRHGDHTLYLEGLRVRVQWTEHPLSAKAAELMPPELGPSSELCVRVEIEESDVRSESTGR